MWALSLAHSARTHRLKQRLHRRAGVPIMKCQQQLHLRQAMVRDARAWLREQPRRWPRTSTGARTCLSMSGLPNEAVPVGVRTAA